MRAYRASSQAWSWMFCSVGVPGPMWNSARHLANRAPIARYSTTRPVSPSSPSVICSLLSGRHQALVDLDPGDHAVRREVLRHGRAVAHLLADRLVVQDHAADVARQVG